MTRNIPQSTGHQSKSLNRAPICRLRYDFAKLHELFFLVRGAWAHHPTSEMDGENELRNKGGAGRKTGGAVKKSRDKTGQSSSNRSLILSNGLTHPRAELRRHPLSSCGLFPWGEGSVAD